MAGEGNREIRPRPSITEAQILLGTAALQPFVEEFQLGLNPEDLSLMVGVVLEHAGDPDTQATDEAYVEIHQDVWSKIEDHARGRALAQPSGE